MSGIGEMCDVHQAEVDRVEQAGGEKSLVLGGVRLLGGGGEVLQHWLSTMFTFHSQAMSDRGKTLPEAQRTHGIETFMVITGVLCSL